MTTQTLYARMAACMKSMERETLQMERLAALSVLPGVSMKRAANDRERANACGLELRRLRHEAHCLAVEIGIADMRTGESYTPVASPIGFGREVLVERRSPSA